MRSPAAAALLLLSIAWPYAAHAGMGAVTPKWHPEPCEGDACKGDDPRSGLPCQGFLCTFSSAKSMQPPVTPAQAEAQRAAATEVAQPVEPAPARKPAASNKKRAKHAAKTSSGKTSSGSDEKTTASPSNPSK